MRSFWQYTSVQPPLRNDLYEYLKKKLKIKDQSSKLFTTHQTELDTANNDILCRVVEKILEFHFKNLFKDEILSLKNLWDQIEIERKKAMELEHKIVKPCPFVGNIEHYRQLLNEIAKTLNCRWTEDSLAALKKLNADMFFKAKSILKAELIKLSKDENLFTKDVAFPIYTKKEMDSFVTQLEEITSPDSKWDEINYAVNYARYRLNQWSEKNTAECKDEGFKFPNVSRSPVAMYGRSDDSIVPALNVEVVPQDKKVLTPTSRP